MSLQEMQIDFLQAIQQQQFSQAIDLGTKILIQNPEQLSVSRMMKFLQTHINDLKEQQIDEDGLYLDETQKQKQEFQFHKNKSKQTQNKNRLMELPKIKQTQSVQKIKQPTVLNKPINNNTNQINVNSSLKQQKQIKSQIQQFYGEKVSTEIKQTQFIKNNPSIKTIQIKFDIKK